MGRGLRRQAVGQKFSLRHVNAHIAKRLEAGINKRTVKIEILVLNNLLNHALEERWINTLPRLSKEARKRLRSDPPMRPLFTSEDLEALCTAAMDTREDGEPVTKNWLQFCDYIRLLAYCGPREQEALRLRWPDVDFKSEIFDHRSRRGRQEQDRPQGGFQSEIEGASASHVTAPCA